MATYHAAVPCPAQDIPDYLAALGNAAGQYPGVSRDVCR